MTLKHATSSVFVFRQSQGGWRLGLIRHPHFGLMVIPGGHVEPAETQAEAALREVAEETGLAVRLVSPPVAALPGGYRPPRVAPPWWIVEYQVPSDPHLGAAHVHIDHLYVALADRAEPSAAAEHPFGWYAAADLPGLEMFDDARLLALTLLEGLSALPALSAVSAGPDDGGLSDGAGPALRAALLARLGES